MTKLFIDTTSTKFILALIDDNKKVVAFWQEKLQNNAANMAVVWIEAFFTQNKVTFKSFDEYYLTIGPGSFTGTKVGLNILKTVNLVYPITKINIISNFDLLRINKKNVAINITKNKLLLNDFKIFNNLKTITNSTDIDRNKLIINYEVFDEKVLEQKINDKSFKLLDNLSKVKLIYGTSFISG